RGTRMVQTAAWVAGALSISAYIPYIWCILRGRCRPELTSWLIWSAEYIALFTALAHPPMWSAVGTLGSVTNVVPATIGTAAPANILTLTMYLPHSWSAMTAAGTPL